MQELMELKVCIIQIIQFAHVISLLQNVLKTMQTLHFEVLVRHELIQVFQVYYWSVPTISLLHEKKIKCLSKLFEVSTIALLFNILRISLCIRIFSSLLYLGEFRIFQVAATGLEPTISQFVNEHSIIQPNQPVWLNG